MEDKKNEAQEFDLDTLLSEFAGEEEKSPVSMDTISMMEVLKELSAEEPAKEETPVSMDTAGLMEVIREVSAPAQEEAPEKAEPKEQSPVSMDTASILDAIRELSGDGPQEAPDQPAQEAPASPEEKMDTRRMNDLIQEITNEVDGTDAGVSEDATIRIDSLIHEIDSVVKEVQEEKAEEAKTEEKLPPIFYNPRTRLKELKKKLVAGPERRYYELSEIGVGRLQVAILVNLLIVVLCAGLTTLYTLELVPENRLRFVIFTQVLAMLVSALFGSNQMIDGLAELGRGRFSLNTLLSITFAACCADAVFCFQELRVPCCAAFSLQMTFAQLGCYHRRSAEMAQMDSLRKAVRLHSIVREPDCFEGKPGILRGEGQVEDFMDHYQELSAPEKLQNFYAMVSFLACLGIAVFAGMQHGISMGFQIFSTSMLVAVPASFFISLTRPMAVLERRLHMVGSVLCGWSGIKSLCGKAAFPLTDNDIFPHGSAKLNGVKFYGERNPDQVVSMTTSLICAAGGGLVPVFRQLLASRDGREYPVENFQDYGSGGIGGEIDGEPVLLGTLNFLQDMGVEIPDGTMVNQAVYASVDGQLAAVFAISYAKMRSSAAGLVSLCGTRKLTPVLVGGDFMLTESLLRSKFSIKTRRMAFPDQQTRRALAARQPDLESKVGALATRDDLVSFAYAVNGARSLRTACRLGMAIHLLGGIVGVLVMLVLAFLGSTELLTPTHVLLYQLVWLVPGWLVTEWTRTV